MKLWLISQTVNSDYDTYDSAVVAAETAEAAVLIHPGGDNRWPLKETRPYYDWAMTITDVNVKLIGDATSDIAPGVILASFNAG